MTRSAPAGSKPSSPSAEVPGPLRDNRDMDQGQATILAALIAVAGTAFGVLVGGRVSAKAAGDAATAAADATREATAVAKSTADADREELRRARLRDDLLRVATDLLTSVERHEVRVWSQLHERQAMAARGAEPHEVPSVGDNLDAHFAARQLYLISDQATADAAWAMYQALIEFTAHASRDDATDRNVMPLDLALADAKTRFIDQVRGEVGQIPLHASSGAQREPST